MICIYIYMLRWTEGMRREHKPSDSHSCATDLIESCVGSLCEGRVFVVRLHRTPCSPGAWCVLEEKTSGTRRYSIRFERTLGRAASTAWWHGTACAAMFAVRPSESETIAWFVEAQGQRFGLCARTPAQGDAIYKDGRVHTPGARGTPATQSPSVETAIVPLCDRAMYEKAVHLCWLMVHHAKA